jgi:uncharacterized protein
MKALFILYVADQKRSADFYRQVLGSEPVLDVPGMTEFSLGDNSSLGLMPEKGIKNLLGDSLPDPAGAAGIPRAEVYLLVDDPAARHSVALVAGGRELSPPVPRPWGDLAGYCLDPDGHVLALGRSLDAGE